MVTYKNKEQFEKWYINDCLKLDTPPKMPKAFMILFYKERFERQIGVCLAYYDSLDVDVKVFKVSDLGYNGRVNGVLINYFGFMNSTRNEAYQEALKQADKLINDKL